MFINVIFVDSFSLYTFELIQISHSSVHKLCRRLRSRFTDTCITKHLIEILKQIDENLKAN